MCVHVHVHVHVPVHVHVHMHVPVHVHVHLGAQRVLRIVSGSHASLTAVTKRGWLTRACAPVLPPAQSCNNVLGVAVAMLITFFKRMKRA